jgi:hypothetical protein
LQTYAGLVASLLAAAVTAQVTGRLADQLQGALEHRVRVEQAVEVLIEREGMDAQEAFQWLRTAARSSEREVVEVAREVLGGAPLPSDRLAQARAQMHEATAATLAEPRPSVCRRPPRAAGSPTRKPSSIALTKNRQAARATHPVRFESAPRLGRLTARRDVGVVAGDSKTSGQHEHRRR